MSRLFPIAIVGIALTPILAFGMGADHSPGDLPLHEGWPAGVYDIVNQANRVHGFWVNSSDILFYQGSHAELHKMIRECAAAPNVNLVIVLHAGSGVAESPWSKQPVGPADWSVTIYGDQPITKHQRNIAIDIWFGGSLTLSDLVIPTSVTVKSGGEIEKFIQEHTAKHEKSDVPSDIRKSGNQTD